MDEPQNVNDILGATWVWRGRPCVRCGRTSSQARLNIEAVIHHGARLECVDRRDCRRAAKRWHT